MDHVGGHELEPVRLSPKLSHMSRCDLSEAISHEIAGVVKMVCERDHVVDLGDDQQEEIGTVAADDVIRHVLEEDEP